MNAARDIPETWAQATIGEVCSQPQYGYTTKASNKGDLRLLRTSDITSGRIEWETVPYCSRNPDDVGKFVLKDGDILVSRAGSVGVSHLVTKPPRAIFASYLIRFKPSINGQFLGYFLQSPDYWTTIADEKLGIAVPNVNATKLKSITLPIPPSSEQRRIVTKIEELFSELDKGVESLKTARAQLKVYRQAVLKHAFEGKLTAKWREENKDKLEKPEQLLARIKREREKRYERKLKEWNTTVTKWEESGRLGKKPARPRKTTPFSMLEVEKLNHSGALPSSWLWLTAESVGTVQLGRQRSPKNRSKYFPTKYIRAANITEQGLALDDILDMDFLPHELNAYRLEKGDLLLAEASGSAAQVGKPAIWADQILNCCFQNTVIRHQPYCRDFAVFLLWLYRYFYLSGKFAQVAGGVGINHLSASRFAQIPLPLCSVAEQQEMVSLLEERFAAIDQAEREVESTLRRTETLRQAVLKKAFSGQLVAQDPNDEPASTLLERIKAEKASRKPRARTRQRKVASA